jgi:hypothetical protein
MHSEFQRYFNILRSSWALEGVIREEIFNITINYVNYTIVLSSPYLSIISGS